MKVNFYNEIRQMLIQEFGLNTEDIKKLVLEEVNNVVKSMVARAVQQLADGKSIEIVCQEAVKKEFNSNTWGVSSAVKTILRDFVADKVTIVVKE